MRGLSFLYSIIAIFTIASSVYADELYTPIKLQSLKAQSQVNPYKKILFNQERFLKAYNIFLQSNHITDAFFLAEVAVEKHPNSFEWRKRFAQAAIWDNRPSIAMEQYTYLATRLNDSYALKEAVRIGTAMNRYQELIPILQYKLKKNPSDINTQLQLAHAYNGNGEPENALKILKEFYLRNGEIIFLKEIADIQSEIGQTTAQLTTLNLLAKKNPKDPNIRLRISEIYYDRSNISQALNILLQGENQEIKIPIFWRTMGDLAWLLSDDCIVRYAYSKQLEVGKIDPESLRRLTVTTEPLSVPYAFQLALLGWDKFSTRQFLILALNYGSDLRRWPAVKNLLSSTSTEDNNFLKREYVYWFAKSKIIQYFNGSLAARNFLERNLFKSPEFSLIQQAYLYLLIDQLWIFSQGQDEQALKAALDQWQPQINAKPDLQEGFIEGLLMFDNPRAAWSIFQLQLPTWRDDHAWLYRYADTLEALELAKSADGARLIAWRKLLQQIYSSDFYGDMDLRNGFAQLSPYFTSATYFYPAMVALAANPSSPDNPNFLLSWAVGARSETSSQVDEQEELAHYLKAYFYPEGFPAWAELNLAIIDNNQEIMTALLETMPAVLPRVDRVTAAQNTNHLPLAQQLAYEGVASQPYDNVRYEQMTDVLLQTANQIAVTQEYKTFGSLAGPLTVLNAKIFITPFWNIQPYIRTWWTRTLDTTSLENPARLDRDIGSIFQYKDLRRSLSVNIGERGDLYDFVHANLAGHYQLDSEFTVGGKIGIHQQSTLNTFMLAGGTQDELIGNTLYQMTSRDQLAAQVEGDDYYTQNRKYLSDGLNLQTALSHKFWLSYPDFTLAVLGQISTFGHPNKIVTGRAAGLVPPTVDQVPTTNDFIPRDFWQTGINFRFGEDIAEQYIHSGDDVTDQFTFLKESNANQYSHAWRPYLSVTFLYDSSVGIGNSADLGIAGSVFGRDKLSFYLSEAMNSQGVQQNNYLGGMRYQVYF